MTIEIVDFPIDSMVIFHSYYVNVYQRVFFVTDYKFALLYITYPIESMTCMVYMLT